MRHFVSKYLMFFAILLMLLQPAQAQAAQHYADDTYTCLNATQKIEKEQNIKKHLLTTISSVETGRWNEKEQQWWMLIVANENAAAKRSGCVGLCVSDDLSRWEYRPPLYAPRMNQGANECPNLFRMGG